jgi:hypothetical protein
MGEGLIWLTSISGYAGIAATAYRIQYVKTYKEYLRWQAAEPNTVTKLDFDSGYGFTNKQRSEVDYWSYFRATDIDRLQPYYLLFWPVILLSWVIWKYLHPEVKVPDAPKINKLEKELDEWDEL